MEKVIQYRGNTRDIAKTEFGESVKNAGGARLYTRYEQMVQIVFHGLDKTR